MNCSVLTRKLLIEACISGYIDLVKKLIECVNINKGYKDGIHGLIIAILLSIYEMLIILQVWDKKRRDSK